MPDPNNIQAPDIAQKAFFDMLTGMNTMAASVTKLAQICQGLGKAIEVLNAKLEDNSAAQDDMRGAIDELTEVSAETGGYMGGILQIMDDLSEGAKDGEAVTWAHVNVAIAKLKTANEEGEEEDES